MSMRLWPSRVTDGWETLELEVCDLVTHLWAMPTRSRRLPGNSSWSVVSFESCALGPVTETWPGHRPSRQVHGRCEPAEARAGEEGKVYASSWSATRRSLTQSSPLPVSQAGVSSLSSHSWLPATSPPSVHAATWRGGGRK